MCKSMSRKVGIPCLRIKESWTRTGRLAASDIRGYIYLHDVAYIRT